MIAPLVHNHSVVSWSLHCYSITPLLHDNSRIVTRYCYWHDHSIVTRPFHCYMITPLLHDYSIVTRPFQCYTVTPLSRYTTIPLLHDHSVVTLHDHSIVTRSLQCYPITPLLNDQSIIIRSLHCYTISLLLLRPGIFKFYLPRGVICLSPSATHTHTPHLSHRRREKKLIFLKLPIEPIKKNQVKKIKKINVYDYYDALCIWFAILRCFHGPCIAAQCMCGFTDCSGMCAWCLCFAVDVGSSGVCMFYVLILMFILVSNCEVLWASLVGLGAM